MNTIIKILVLMVWISFLAIDVDAFMHIPKSQRRGLYLFFGGGLYGLYMSDHHPIEAK